MSDAVKRPPILAGACLYLGLLAAVMSIRAVTMVSSWNADSRADDVATGLRLLRDAGLGADGAETAYKAGLTVLAVLGAMGVVFAVFTARGDRASRVGMTVVIGVTGLATFAGALGTTFFLAMLGALSVAFTARLWTGEVRTYFRTLAGHPPPPPRTPKPSAAETTPDRSSVSAPAEPFGDPSRRPLPPSVHPATPPPGAWSPARDREPLPRSVAVAVWTTFIGSIVAVVVGGLVLLTIGVSGLDYDAVIEQGGPGADMIRGSEGDFDTALRLLVTLCSIAVVLGLVGLLAAVRVLRARRSGEVLLFVMTVVTLLFSVVGFPLGVPWTAAAIVALVQLRKRESRAWFAGA